MVEKKVIAIIPARGGSKRIPRKNIVDFMGKPMIAWTIEAALDSGLFEKVLVSTDDAEIRAVSRKFGAEVPFLRKNYSDDYSPVSMATLDMLTKLEEIYDEKYDIVVQLMANCPLRSKENIQEAYENFERFDLDFQLSCFKFGWMNPRWAVEIDSFGKPEPLFPSNMKERSQDIKGLYCPTGAIWIANVEKFKKEKTFYGYGYRFHNIDWTEAVDIDDIEDLEMANAVYILKREIAKR